MSERKYWLDLFTEETWNEFLAAGGTVTGFRSTKWKTVQRVRPGDYFLCYLTGSSRFVGILEVTGDAFHDETPLWAKDVFPSRLPVQRIVALNVEHGVPISEVLRDLTIYNEDRPLAWTGHVRGSPTKWTESDGMRIVSALTQAKEAPVVRPITKRRVKEELKPYQAKIGAVTVPDVETTPVSTKTAESEREGTEHDEVQYLLLKLGSDLGLDVWVARNDKGRSYRGSRFADLERIRDDIPLQFDDATNRTIQLIDVLWLKGNAIIAAFEIESTTSIYSGLLRMSDLVAMQPNLKVALYLVAPSERRRKVLEEVNRPTFSRLQPPLKELCRFISFDKLREKIAAASEVMRYLRPEYVEEMAETCDVSS